MSQQQFQAVIDPYLQWDPLPGEARRIRILMGFFLGIAVIWCLVQPHIPIPKESRAQEEAIPETLAKFVQEEKVKPLPPKPIEKPEEKKPEEKKTEETKPKEEQPEEVEPKPVQMDEKTQKARAAAKKALQDAGIDQLASLRDMNFDNPTPNNGLDQQPGNGNGGLITNTEGPGTSRSLLTSRAGSGSGGLAAQGYGGNYSSGFGGGTAGGKGSKGGANGFGLNGTKTASISSKIAADVAATPEKLGKNGKAVRSDEDIRDGFDRFGPRFQNAAKKFQRDNPTIQGNVTLKLTIQPDGSVSSCSIGASEIDDQDLQAKFVTICKGLNFGAADVDTYNGSFVLSVLPAS